MGNWGLLPDDVYSLIESKEWCNHKNLQQRLLGNRSFPITVLLKPPTEQQILADMAHFQNFVSVWQNFSLSKLVEWQERNYRSLKSQKIPHRLIIPSMQALLEYLGNDAIECSRRWQLRMEPLLKINDDFYPVLVKHLQVLESLLPLDIELLQMLLPQLKKDLGVGLYLRALPIVGVDTKFIETYSTLIADLLDTKYVGQVTQANGLLSWLGCLRNPSDWFTVRPLCGKTQTLMGSFPIMQLSAEDLQLRALPAKNILVIENLASGLGLPEIKNTIAVFGRGRNVSWMKANWLKTKNLGYWGDIDTWGLAILSEARTLAPNLEPLMMDKQTILEYKDRTVEEEKKYPSLPTNLNRDEMALFNSLKNDDFGRSRLEQERLPADYSNKYLQAWAMGATNVHQDI